MMQQIAGNLYLIGAFSLAGTSVIAGRYVSDLLGTFTIAAMSLAFALVGLLPLCGRSFCHALTSLPPALWLKLFLQALFGIFLFRMFLLEGLVLTSAGEAGILTGITPAATAVLAWLLLKEPLARLRVAGIACSLAGVLVIQGLFSGGNGFAAGHFAGNLLVVCAALSESLFNVLSRSGMMNTEKQAAAPLEPLLQSTLVAGIALLLCLPPALTEKPLAALGGLGIDGWASLVWYGLFVTALAFVFWYNGIQRCPASVAAVFSGMMPVTAMLLSILLLGEQPGAKDWLGGLLVLLGMVLTGSKLPAGQAGAKGT